MLIIVMEMDGELEHFSDLQSRYYRKDGGPTLLETHHAASWNDSSRMAELSIHGPLIRLMIGFVIVLFLQKTLGEDSLQPESVVSQGEIFAKHPDSQPNLITSPHHPSPFAREIRFLF
jgi:hypothetical protein